VYCSFVILVLLLLLHCDICFVVVFTLLFTFVAVTFSFVAHVVTFPLMPLLLLRLVTYALRLLLLIAVCYVVICCYCCCCGI